MKAMTKQIPKHLSKRSPRYPPSFSGKTEQIFSRVQTRAKHGKATLLREFVEKIVVHECSYDENKTRRQDIEIYYSFVGKVDLPE